MSFPFLFPFPSQSTFVSGSITRTQNHTDGSEAMELCLYRWKTKQPGNGKLCLFNTPYFQREMEKRTQPYLDSHPILNDAGRKNGEGITIPNSEQLQK